MHTLRRHLIADFGTQLIRQRLLDEDAAIAAAAGRRARFWHDGAGFAPFDAQARTFVALDALSADGKLAFGHRQGTAFVGNPCKANAKVCTVADRSRMPFSARRGPPADPGRPSSRRRGRIAPLEAVHRR